MEMVTVDLARCYFCNHEGEYRKDIIDIDHVDITGRDTIVCACRDFGACLNRVKGVV
jgi:hypothetical protein